MKKILLLLLAFVCFSANAQQRIIGANNVVTILAGETMGNWSLVRIENGKAYKADPTDINKAAVGIAIDTALNVNDTIQVAYGGILQGFEIAKGKNYYLAVDAKFDTIQPESVYYQRIGQWVEDSTLQISIQSPVQIFDTEKYVRLSEDLRTSTDVDTIPELYFPIKAGSYKFEFDGTCLFPDRNSGIFMFLLVGEPSDDAYVSCKVGGLVSHAKSQNTVTITHQSQNDAQAGTDGTNGTGTDGVGTDGQIVYIKGTWIVTTIYDTFVKLKGGTGTTGTEIRIYAGATFSCKKID